MRNHEKLTQVFRSFKAFNDVSLSKRVAMKRELIAQVLFVAAILAATCAAYYPGLTSPLVLDDLPNLEPLLDVLDGELSSWSFVFGNESGVLGRPVSMATFLLNGVLFGDSIFAIKAFNLVVHMICGVVVYFLVLELLKLRNQNQPWTPSLVCALWLLAPMHASTVLYAVQRMAQLSTLFILLLLYASTRILRHRRIYINFKQSIVAALSMCLLFLLAVLSKENGILAFPLVCSVALYAFSERAAEFVNRRTALFFGGLFAVVAVGTICTLGLFGDGYDIRHFSLHERLLTQARALSSYLLLLTVPLPSSFGVYTDGYTVSTSLFDPVTTSFAVLFWVASIALIPFIWSRYPLQTLGLLFFLIGHSLESTLIPLENYFEHRNYLPSVGIYLFLISSLTSICNRWSMSSTMRMLGSLCFLGYFLFCLHIQALQWSKHESTLAQAVVSHPLSARAHIGLMQVHLDNGRPDDAVAVLRSFARNGGQCEESISLLYQAAISCRVGGVYNRDLLDRLAMLRFDKITTIQAASFRMFKSGLQYCTPYDALHLARTFNSIAEHSGAYRETITVGELRALAGEQYFVAGLHEDAARSLALAWDNQFRLHSVGDLLIRALVQAGKIPQARARLKEYEDMTDFTDEAAVAQLRSLERAVEQEPVGSH